MRSEDLSGIPESIERWKVGELLEGLGFEHGSYKNMQEVRIEDRKIYVRVLATDENGRRYLEGNEAAVHEISIPFVGGWEKPDPISRCAAVLAPDSWALNCERGPAHSGEHLAHFEGTEQRW